METTTETKSERLAWIQRRRTNHHNALESLATNGANGLKIWRQLRRLENEVYKSSLAFCNGEIDQDQWETVKDQTRAKLTRIFGQLPNGVYVNGDARGHALKLDCDKVTIPSGMERDWGGNGILAAEIE